MKAVILVGGEGTRLRPLTATMPKPMLPVVNQPFLEHVFDYLKSQGIDDVILSMGYRSDVIENHFGDGDRFGIKLRYVVESKPLGTAGGVKNVERFLDGSFFVFNGDILTDLDLRAMLDVHRETQSVATISLTPVEDPTAYGLVETNDRGRVQRFLEKPRPDEITTNLINAGTYILEPRVLDLIPENTFHMFERGVFPDLLRLNEPIYGYRSDCYWIDIGTPAKYLAVHRDILDGRVAQRAHVAPTSGVKVGAGTSIDPTALVTGPVVIGKNVKVGPHVKVSGPSVIGDNCEVGAESEIDRAVIWAGVQTGQRSVIRESIVGRNVKLGDEVNVIGGAIVADQCTIGRENRLDRGIRIWPGFEVPPKAITF